MTRRSLELVAVSLAVAALTWLLAWSVRPAPPADRAVRAKARAAWTRIPPAQRATERAAVAVANARARRDTVEAEAVLRPPAPIGLVTVERFEAERSLRVALEAQVAAMAAELEVTRAALAAAQADADAGWQAASAVQCRILWLSCPSRAVVAAGALALGVAAGLALSGR